MKIALSPILLVFSLNAFALTDFGALDQEAPATMQAKEQFLNSIDLSQMQLKQLAAGNTTKTAWQVKDRQSGRTVALLKCTSGNTYAPAAVATYALGKYLDFTIQPVAISRTADVPGHPAHGQICALKEWTSNWAQYYWKAPQGGSSTDSTFTKTSSSHKKALSKALLCQNSYRSDDSYVFYSKTSYSHPSNNDGERTKLYGQTTLGQAAKDFSNLMVLDAIIGNGDRFPGGNLNFRATMGTDSNADGSYTFKSARLFSLDNAASFKGAAAIPRSDLKKYVSRFDSEMIDKLRDLKADIEAGSTPSELIASLDFNVRGSSVSASKYIVTNIDFVLKRVEAAESQCGSSAYFK